MMEIHCLDSCILSAELTSDIRAVYKDFIQTQEGKDEIFFLFDIVEKDDSNEVYILTSKYLFEVMFKRPDCYFKDNGKIVYIHTENYINVNDSSWLKNLLTETHEILGAPNFNVSWVNDSVIGPIYETGDFNKINPLFTSYDPIPFKYIVRNGLICSKEVVNKVYYPDNRKPKGFPVIFRTYPYWPKEECSYYNTIKTTSLMQVANCSPLAPISKSVCCEA